MRKIHDYDVQLSYTWEILCQLWNMLNLFAFVDKCNLDSVFDSNKSKMGERMRVIYDAIVPYKLDNIELDDFSKSTDFELNWIQSYIIKGFCWTQIYNQAKNFSFTQSMIINLLKLPGS